MLQCELVVNVKNHEGTNCLLIIHLQHRIRGKGKGGKGMMGGKWTPLNGKSGKYSCQTAKPLLTCKGERESRRRME